MQSATAATTVAASDASAASKASAQFVCDGSGDQEEINNALARGGEIILTEGTFRTSGTVYVKSNSVFRGQGADKTVLSMAGDYAARVDIAQSGVTVSDFKITNRGWLMITTSNVKVHDVTIQDSKKTAPTVNGMFFVWADGRTCENIEFVRCKAIDVGSTGFNLNGMRSPRVNRNIRFEDCLALRCGNAGSGKIWAVGFDFHEGADLYDLYVNNCRAEDCWESGFYFEPNFRNPADPNTAIPVQVNSRVNNCVAVNNGWRNTEPTRFYMSGFYLSCGVTLKNCLAINNRKNGFWVWQCAEDVVLQSCIDSGSDCSFQLRTGQRLRLENCFSKSARTYALYMWGSERAVISNFQLINPKSPSGCIAVGLRDDHPEEWWPVRDSTLDIRTTGADANRLFRYYNGERNLVTVNGLGQLPVALLPLPTPPTTVPTTAPTAPVATTDGPQARGFAELPGAILAADYDDGGEGSSYHDTSTGNSGGYYRSDDVDIERSPCLGAPVVAYTRPGEWLDYTVNVSQTGVYEATVIVSSPQDGRSFSLSIDGVNFGQFAVPNTGSFETYSGIRRLIWIGAGQHTLRIETQGYHNIHLIQVYPPGETPGVTTLPTTVATSTPATTAVTPVTMVPTSATPTPTPTTEPGHAVPGYIEAEDYETGGEGTGYHDTTPGNAGGYYRSDDVDIRFSEPAGSGVITSVEAGEWLRYRLRVAVPGVYMVNLSAGSTRSGDVVELLVDGTCMARVSVPVSSDARCQPAIGYVYLPAGQPGMELRFTGRAEVDAFALTQPGGPTLPPRTSVPTTIATAAATSPPSPTVTPTATQSASATITTVVPTVPATVQPSLTLIPSPSVTSTPVPTPTATPIVEVSLPGTVQAENWSELGPTASSMTCITPVGTQGMAVSSRVEGAWTAYPVNATRTGIVEAVIRLRPVAAGGAETGTVRLLIDDTTWMNLTVKGDPTAFVNRTQLVYLQQGIHRVRLELGRGLAVDYLSFQPAGASGNAVGASTATPTFTPAPVAPSDLVPPVNMTAPITMSPGSIVATAALPAVNVTQSLTPAANATG